MIRPIRVRIQDITADDESEYPVKNQKITGEAHCQPPCVYFGYRIKPNQNAKPTPKYGRPLSLSG